MEKDKAELALRRVATDWNRSDLARLCIDLAREFRALSEAPLNPVQIQELAQLRLDQDPS